MTGREKTREQLLTEIDDLRSRLAELERSLPISDDSFSHKAPTRAVATGDQAYEQASLLERILEKAAIGICVCHNMDDSPYLRFTHWNPMMTRITGYSMDEINRLGWHEALYASSDTRDRAIERTQRLFQGADLVAEEWDVISKHGEERTLTVSSSVLREEHGRTYLMGLVNDVTEVKRHKAELEAGEKRFSSLVETMGQGFGMLDEEGIFTYVNQKMCEMLGRAKEETIGRRLVDFLRSDSAQLVREQLRSRWEGKSGSYEVTFVRRDGKQVRSIVAGVPVFDREGNFRGSFGACADITERRKMEKELKESREQLALAMQSANLGLWDWDLSTGRGSWDEQFHTVMGYQPGDLKADLETWKSLVHPDDWPRMVKSLKDHIDGAQPMFQVDYRIRDKAGEWRWNQALGKVVGFDEAGEALRMAGVALDITERKRTEEALRKQAQIVSHVHDAIVTSDVGGRITSWNKGAERLHGYSEEEMLGKRVVSLFPEDYGPSFWGPLLKELENKNEHNLEVPMLKRSGETFWAYLSFSYLRDPEGKLIGTVGYALDITEKKLAEEALQRSESTLRTLLQAAPIGIGQVTKDRVLGWTNQLMSNMLGYSREELEGKSVRSLYESDEEFERVGRVKHAEILRRGTGTVETRLRRKDGSGFDVLVSSSAIVPGDLSSGMVFTAMDITERKQLEEQLLRSQKMEAVGTLTGGIAHDFNNLLQVINGCADLALFDLREGQQGYLEMKEIKAAARSAAELTEGLLTFSRRVESTLRVVDLNREVQSAARILRRTIPKMIDMELQLSPDLSPIHADPTQIQQIVVNLAVNARDAMSEGGRLEIRTDNVDLDEEFARTHMGGHPGEYVVMAVSDTGCGISKEIAARLYEPFFTTKEIGKGTGLGLSVVYGIVQNHGGIVECSSEPGRGTTFLVYLPVVDEIANGALTEQRRVLVGGRETILLVDDEESVLNLGERLLKRFGYTALTASNGKKALDILSSQREGIDLVILDLMMPEMSGRECLREIMKLDPSAKVLVASGYSADGHIAAALEDGAIESVRKPYETRRLLEAIRRIMDEDHSARGDATNRGW